MQHINDPPAPPSAFADIPGGVESAILRCLEKDPERRFQTMADVATALNPWIASGDPTELAALIRVTRQGVLREEKIANAATMAYAGEHAALLTTSFRGSPLGFIRAPPAPTTPPPPAPTGPQVGPSQRWNSSILEGISSAAESGPRIELILSDGGAQVYPLNDGTTSIGRAADSGIVLDDHDGVSRYHAMIQRTPDGYVFVDMNTRNGSYVNGTRVLEPTMLADLDEVQIGGARFRFHAQ